MEGWLRDVGDQKYQKCMVASSFKQCYVRVCELIGRENWGSYLITELFICHGPGKP